VDVFADGAIDDILDSYYHDRALLLEEYGVPLEQNESEGAEEIAHAVGASSDRNQQGSSAGPGDAAGATSSSNGERQAAAFARSINTTGPSPIVDAALPEPPLGKGASTTTSPVALVSIESSATTTTPLLPMKEDQLPKQQPDAQVGVASMGLGFATSTPKYPGEGETRAVAAAMRERGAYLGRDHSSTAAVAPAPLTPVSDAVALTPMEEENATRGSSPSSGVHHDNFGEVVNFGGAVVVDMRVPARGAQPPYHEYLDLERPQRARSMSVSLSEPSMVSSMATGPAPLFT
jgi:hypothetical protein